MEETYIFKTIAIPLLMLTDYYLTIYSDFLRKKAHTNFFQIDNFELNPIWIKDINRRRLFNPKHLILIALASILIWYFICRPENDSSYNRILYGAFVTTFCMVTFRHISNVILFKFIIINPQELNGKITYSVKYSYIASSIQYLVGFGAILPLALLTHSYYIYGGLIGSLVLIVVHLFWYRKHIKNSKN